MSTYEYPGVYIEEQPGAPAPIQGVAASTLGIAGWTTKGVAHKATLVTGWTDFVKKFGSFTAKGKLPTALYAFFQNGGQRAQIVRTTPSDAVAASLYVQNDDVTENVGNGNGSTASFTKTLAGAIVPGTLVISTYKDGSGITGEQIGTGNGSTTTFAYTIASANRPIKRGTLVVSWTSGSVAKSMTDNGSGVFTGHGAAGSSTVNYTTGAISINTTGAVPDNSTNITIAYTPLETMTATDDGEGTFEGDVTGTNTINYTTGAVTVTFDANVTNDTSLKAVSATWDEALQKFEMQWPGAEGNKYRIRIEGADLYEEAGEGTHTRYNVIVDLQNSAGAWVEQERASEPCVFDDDTSSAYLSRVVNDVKKGMSLVKVATIYKKDVPDVLKGVAISDESLGTGNGSTTRYTGTLVGGTAVPYSINITTTSAADAALTVTDNGSGKLIGSVNSNGTNTINYDTGAYDVTFSAAVKNSTAILGDYVEEPESASYTKAMAGGSDGSAVTSADVTVSGLEASEKGIYAFDKVSDILLVILPDFAGDSAVDGAAIGWCDTKTDRFYICTTPSGYETDKVRDYKQNVLARISKNAAMYWPWVYITDPVTNKTSLFPPLGHVAGVYARTINNKNVSKAPAGQDDGQLRFVVGCERELKDSEMAIVNPIGVNSILKRSTVGTAVWGARTLDVDSEWRYVQVRMLALFLEKSIYNSTHWINFENNDPELWGRIKFQLNAFFGNLFRAKYFSGVTEKEAFFIVCDETNNPQDSIDAGRVFIDVGFAPKKPAEFVIFRLSQMTQTS